MTGMSRKELAERLNVSESAVSRYLSGERGLSADKIVEISKILQISSDRLLGLHKGGIEQFDIYNNVKEKVVAMSKSNRKRLLIELVLDIGKDNKKEIMDIVNLLD